MYSGKRTATRPGQASVTPIPLTPPYPISCNATVVLHHVIYMYTHINIYGPSRMGHLGCRITVRDGSLKWVTRGSLGVIITSGSLPPPHFSFTTTTTTTSNGARARAPRRVGPSNEAARVIVEWALVARGTVLHCLQLPSAQSCVGLHCDDVELASGDRRSCGQLCCWSGCGRQLHDRGYYLVLHTRMPSVRLPHRKPTRAAKCTV